MDDAGFHLSSNIDDRRDEGVLRGYSSAVLAALKEQGFSLEEIKHMMNNPFLPYKDLFPFGRGEDTPAPPTPLATQAGAQDLDIAIRNK